jgi:hypothetical protein
MVKDKTTVIEYARLPLHQSHLTTAPREFNDLVNMTPNELRAWLAEEQSQSSGWMGASASGETVGHESGRRIVDVLEQNPSKDPSGYSDEDLEHMRRVVSYCKRHLAQEEHAKRDTGSRSYRSLKNWGHDALKE